MKKLLLSVFAIVFVLTGATKLFSFPIYDPFNYTPGQTLWGRTDGNGDFWYEIDSGANPANPIVVANLAVTYPGLPASAGNSIVLSNLSGGQGGRVFVNTNNTAYFFGNGASGAPYPGPIEVLYSLVIDVTNMANLGTGVYCFGFNDQGTIGAQSANPGTMGYRLYFKAVNSTNYQVGISKETEGPYYATNILSTNQNVLIVVDEIINSVGEPQNSSGDVGELWVNPPTSSFGSATEPAYSAQEPAGAANDNLTPYTSCFIFENRSTTTPNALLVGQFRMGTNWAWVTGGPCVVNTNAATLSIFGTGFNLLVNGLDNGSPNTFQWQLNGTNLSNGPSISGSGATVSGATSTNLTVTNATAQDGGQYSIIVSNTIGSYTTLVSTVSISVPQAPTFTTEPGPSPVPLYPGGSDVISFTAQGTTPLVYYWYSNNTVVAVTTNLSTLTISNVSANATIYCLASNVVGTNATSSVVINLQALPTAPYPLAVINDNPIGFWKLNEHPDNSSGDDGTAAIDYMGGNNGYYTNGIINQAGYGTGLAGEFGYATPTDPTTSAEFGYYPSFPATNSLVAAISNISFAAVENSPSFSIEAWVNSEGNPPTDGAIVAKGWGTTANGGGDQFSLQYNGGWQFYVRDASGINTTVTSGVTDTDANWHHLVAVCDIPTTTLLLYVDGLLTSSNAAYPTISGTNTIGIETINLPVTIASAGTTASSGYNKNWQGDIDDVAIYNYALSASQVTNHYYSAGVGPTISLPANTNVNEGATLIVPATIRGTPPLTYQWFDVTSGTPGTAVTGQTNSTLVISNISAAAYNDHSFDVTVTGNYGQATSSAIFVTVQSGPPTSVTLTPTALTGYAGWPAVFTVTAQGTQPISYQWSTNGVNVAGATNAVYSNIVSLGGPNTIECVLTNAYSAGSPATVSGAITGVAAPRDSYALDVLGDQPLAYWRLDEPANASIANDYVGGHDAAYIDAVTGQPGFQPSAIPSETAAVFGSDGFTNNSLALENDNTGNGVANIDFSTQDPNGEFSVEAWLNAPAGQNTSGAGIVALGFGNGGEQFCLDTGASGGAFRFFVRDTAAATTGASSTTLPDGKWHHLVGVCDEGNGLVTLYIDGAKAASSAISPGAGILPAPAGFPLCIGSRSQGSNDLRYLNQLINSSMDDVALYAYPLSSNQVAAHYTLGLVKLTIQYVATNNTAVISWPNGVSGYVLQQSATLSSPNWTGVTNAVSVVNGQNEVVVPIPNSAQFYRLLLQ